MRLGVVTTTTLFQSILQWLRAGYPAGVPGPDRVPLLALLRATPLTEDQIKDQEEHLTAEDPKAHGDGPENVQRVAAKLAAAGWPLSGISGDAT
jgi:hypothetical protein